VIERNLRKKVHRDKYRDMQSLVTNPTMPVFWEVMKKLDRGSKQSDTDKGASISDIIISFSFKSVRPQIAVHRLSEIIGVNHKDKLRFHITYSLYKLHRLYGFQSGSK
jgi:hypothetical protein